jgi:ABC-type transport system involved in multi-copper enzyme maturation permease subunit
MSGFGQLLRAEWTKLRTVPGWVGGVLAAAAVIVGLGLLPGMTGSCGQHGPGSECIPPVGPGGEQVTDRFFFVHRPLAGDGSITVRVTRLTGLLPAHPDEPAGTRSGVAPWAKAGLIVKDGTRPGSAYAAVMVTGSHGVRMQYDYTHDVAGSPGPVSASAPRWLRLTRSGDTVTAAESADGTAWTTVGSARLAGLPATVQVGLFATSPQYAESVHESAMSGAYGGPTQVTAVFDHVTGDGTWTGEAVGEVAGLPAGEVEQAGGRFTVTGSGDIAPAVSGAAGGGTTVTQTLVGTFAGLIAVIVVAALFVTAEYRRGLIRTTLAATPRRGRVLAAKAVVVGSVAFGAGLAGAAVVVTLGQRVLRGNGVYVFPATALTEVRLVVGTAALLAVTAVLALAVGAVVRRSAATVAAALVVIVLPYLLAMTILPTGAAQWLLRVTPAAAFAIQQSALRYPQVSNLYTPSDGYFPLAPWAGLAVLGAWAALALGLALVLFRRRDV